MSAFRCRAFSCVTRYVDAIDVVRQSIQVCEGKKGLRDVYCWPGTDKFIQHTDKAILTVSVT